MINILGYNFLKVKDYISETAIVLEKHRDYEVLTGLKWYFIELPKFRKQNPDMNEKINQWLAFIDDYNKEMIKVKNKEYALALSGGGTRGAYEIGAYRALKEMGINIVAIAGTSIGALNGAIFVSDNLDKAEKMYINIIHHILLKSIFQ